MIPKVMPNGFFRADVTEEERIIGKSGQIQGAKIVINPDKKAKTIKSTYKYSTSLIKFSKEDYLVTLTESPSSTAGALTVILLLAVA